MKIEKILIFRLSSIGDIVLTSSLIRCIRNTYPSAKIDFVVKKQFLQLVENNPFLDTVYGVDSSEGLRGLRQLKNRLKENKYDVFLDIHKNFRSIYFRTFFGGAKIFTYKKNILKRSLLVHLGFDIYSNEAPVYKRFVSAASKLHVVYDNEYTDFFIPENKKAEFQDIASEMGFNANLPYIVLGPGASFYNKCWPKDKFVELCDKLTNAHHQIALIGGPAEQETCDIIKNMSSATIYNFAGKLDLLQSAALLENATVTVVNDTGMLHLSEALRTPVIGLYGPTVTQFGYYPILPNSIGLSIDLKCRPCTKMGKDFCPKKHFKCMLDLSSERVYDTLKLYI